MKTRKGFLEGVGWPLGRVATDGERPWKAAKADGVSAMASAGGGRPVTFARSVRSQRSRVKMPRIEPRVFRRFPNCSATETIAGIKYLAKRATCTNRALLTKET